MLIELDNHTKMTTEEVIALGARQLGAGAIILGYCSEGKLFYRQGGELTTKDALYLIELAKQHILSLDEKIIA